MVLTAFVLISILLSETRADDKVQVRTDVPYRSGDLSDYERERCKLDLYLPVGVKEFATMVWFHGGALKNGDKQVAIAKLVAERFARDGVAVASVSYRLSPQVKFPAYIEDAAAAFAYVHKHIAKHGGSPRKVFVSGHSAGGYLASMVGLDPQYLARQGLKQSDIAGLLPVAGQMVTHSTVREERGIPPTRPLIDHAAPAFHVRSNVPPCLHLVGDRDLPARLEENAYFIAAMKAAGHSDATFLKINERTHDTIARHLSLPHDVGAKAMLDFMQRVSAARD